MAVLCEGTHTVYVTRTNLGGDEQGKTPFVAVGFDNGEGATITAYLYLSEKAWPIAAKSLKTLGWDPIANGMQFDQLDADPSPIAGNQVDIVVEEEMYEGKLRSKVKWINPVGGLVPERMDPTQARSFAARLKAKLSGVAVDLGDVKPPPAERRLPRQPQANGSAQKPADEDLPF